MASRQILVQSYQISMKEQSVELGRVQLSSYPLHNKHKEKLLTYNLYSQDPSNGVTDSQPLRLPLIREGCMTTCYFQGFEISLEALRQPCSNCLNKSARVYLDVGFKKFLQQHHKYIRVNQPLSVELNPFRHEFLFCSGKLKNNLLSQLSSYIGWKIFDSMRMGELTAVNTQILDFPKMNQELQTIMTPVVKRKNYLLYNFCKYVPLPGQDKDQLHIFLFLFGQKQPIKARILIQGSNSEMCSQETYLRESMIGFLGQLNTLVFAVPLAGATEYFIAQVGQHFSREEGVLRVMVMKGWKDPLGRFNANMVVDQKTRSIFVIGGYDNYRNDSLEYISCFIRCRWEDGEKRELKADIEKSHRMFQGRIGTYNTGAFNTVFKNPYNEDKIAFRNATFMMYAFDREDRDQLQTEIAEGIKKMQKDFFNVGGRLKDSAIFATGRFSTKKPGIRSLKYDTSSNENPIICETPKGDLNFSGNNYIIIQLPYISAPRKKFPNHCMVIGGHRDPSERSSKDDPDFTKIYLLNTNNLDQIITLGEQFKLSLWLPDMVDQFTAILKDPSGNFYLRATYPLKTPLEVKEGFVNYIGLEFGLSTSLFEVLPGIIEKRKEQA